MNNLPAVSVVMPILNEQRHLESAVERVFNQDYAGQVELILALGPSTDLTNEIANKLANKYKEIKLITNPTGKTPNALNLAIREAKFEIIVRLDGHALIQSDYLRIAVETLISTEADNVGGIMDAQGTTNFEKAVARAMTSKFGVGNAPFHIGGQAQEALTVYLGVFRKNVFDRVGFFNEDFVRAQDWELNYRIRSSGGKIWFNPKLKVTYRPRSNLLALAKQYFQYGQGRKRIVKHHKESVSLRYLTPPLTVLGITFGTLLGFIGLFSGIELLQLGFLAPLIYLAAVLLASGFGSRGLSFKSMLFLPIVFICMHICWGVGFLRRL